MFAKTTIVLSFVLCAQVLAVRPRTPREEREHKSDGLVRRTRESRFLLEKIAFRTNGKPASEDGRGSTAHAGATLRLNGPGKVSVDVKSKGIGVTMVKNAFAGAMVKARDDVEKGGDAVAIAFFEARAYGTAIAQALAKARVRLSSDAEGGFACAFAQADARSTATAYATALVEAHPLRLGISLSSGRCSC